MALRFRRRITRLLGFVSAGLPPIMHHTFLIHTQKGVSFITNMTIINQEMKVLNHKSAIAYVKYFNWAVFPVVESGKAPLTKNGFLDATRDIDQINEWWRKIPNANIGIPTGEINGFFVLDVDVQRKDGLIVENGFETLRNLSDQYGKLPDTVIQISGSGEGNHYLFKYHDSIKNNVKFLPGLDIRGAGGYIVAPPSTHESGNKYEWELSSHPSDTKIVEAPKWLIDHIQKPKQKKHYKAKPTSEYVRIMQGVDDGERNNSLVMLIGHLLARKIHFTEAFEIVHMWNESRVNPPLSADVVTKAFNNIMRKEAEKG